MRHRSNYDVSRKPIHGFTLIELLVVISIIALLLSILIPSLSSAKKRAVSVICASNMRQNQLALMFYLGDNNQYFPQSSTAGNARWYVLLDKAGYNFVGKRCPSSRTTGGTRNLIAYAYNAGLGHTANPPWGLARRRYHRDGRIITFCESFGNFFWNSQIGQGLKCGEPWDGRRGIYGRLSMPHNDGQNISFLDGRVEYRKIDSLSYEDWSVNY